MTSHIDEALGATVTFSTGALSMVLGSLTDAVPITAAWLGLALVLVRLVYEGLRLRRYIIGGRKTNGKGIS